MMKKIAILMSVKPEGLLRNIKIAHVFSSGFTDIKIANVFHHPDIYFIPYIYILYYQSTLLNYLPLDPVSYPYKNEIFHLKRGVGTARAYVNDDKQRKLLADIDVTPPSGAV